MQIALKKRRQTAASKFGDVSTETILISIFDPFDAIRAQPQCQNS
jgi:hypothetical protein